ncbi:MarR family winged helix-turn-helix transcriptional regulator [Corynebacterium epidermidicanis]|uniref:Transcriptional regulator n=1 Tax=Corynebacterium epidermidicanis TaxID=1050174 RepID=A0A0G3GQH1_9CORY|nr:MarR family transcriptional regulator [Corynebacterium epidermidicanis]AKK03451.1 transcriptional regulator [Corynebacterium epidermidicanis]
MSLPVNSAITQWHDALDGIDPTPMQTTMRLSRLFHEVDGKITGNIKRFDLQPWQFDVLATLRRSGPLCASDLAESALISASALTNRIDRLIAQGLVTRDTDPHSRRRTLINLTPAGRELIDATLPSHLETCASAFPRLSAAEKAQLDALLAKALGEN